MPGAPQNTVIGGASLWVMSGKKPAEYKGVAKFFTFLSETDRQAELHTKSGYLPITKAAYAKVKASGFYKDAPYLETPLLELTVDEFDKVMGVNARGTMLMMQYGARRMIQAGVGRIANFSSITAYDGGGTFSKIAYAAGKAAVIGLTRGGARELGQYGITTNCICPGPILTEQTKQYPPEVFATWNAGRAIIKDGLPEDVADAVVFLASARSAWVTGITLDVNGGILIRG